MCDLVHRERENLKFGHSLKQAEATVTQGCRFRCVFQVIQARQVQILKPREFSEHSQPFLGERTFGELHVLEPDESSQCLQFCIVVTKYPTRVPISYRADSAASPVCFVDLPVDDNSE